MIQILNSNTEILDFIRQSVIIICDFKILYFNFCFSEMSGMQSSEICGKNFLDFVSQKDKNKVLKYILNINENSNSCAKDIIDFVLSHNGQKEHLVELNAKSILFRNKKSLICSLTDITIRSRKTKELNRILDAIPEVIIAFDNEHKIINSANSATEGLYGIPAEQFTSNAFHPIDLVLDEDIDRVKKFYFELLDLEYDKIEYRIVSSSGEIKWVRDEGEVVYKEHGNGSILQVYHFIKDITERKQDLEKLRISEKKYRRIFEHSTDPIFVVTPAGNFLDINDAAIRLFGFKDKQEALTKNITDNYLDLNERDKMVDKIRTEGSVTDHPIKIKTYSGNVVEVMMTAGCKNNLNTGALESYQVIIHDISYIIEKTELEAYRRTLGGISDRLNNITQSQIMHFGLIHDYIDAFNSATDDVNKQLIITKLLKAIADSEGIVADLKMLGIAVRKIYHKPEPPKPVSDGTGGILFDLKFS